MSSVLVRDGEEREDPVQLSPDQLVPSSKLGKNLGAYLDRARRHPVFVLREQKVEAVLVNIDRYRTLLQEEERAEDLYYATLSLRRLLELHLSGRRTFSLDEVMQRFGVVDPENERETDDEVEG